MLNLWNITQGYGSHGAGLGYLSDEQNVRLERIRVARMLWRGQHRQAFLEEGRTQWPFTPMNDAWGVTRIPYVPYNVLRLITTTVTDLLIGAEPLLKVAEADGQQAVNDLFTRSDLHRVFYNAAKEASWAAESTVEVSRYDGQVYVANLNPGEVFPLGERNPDGQYSSYRRFATAKVGERTLLLETTYNVGRIERACFELSGSSKSRNLDLSQWPTKRPDGSDLPAHEATGIDWNTIVWMANELDEGNPTSDYDGLIDLQDELNHKQTQIARVIAKHADPKMALPAFMADAGGNINGTYDVFYFRNKDEIPSYVTWNAELAHAIADRDFTLFAMAVASETSPVLLGIKQGATPDAARKVRLEATKTLARKDRKATFFRPFVRTALDTAMKLERAAKRIVVAVPSASIELRDGLPVDELDEAQALSLFTGGKAVMSVERAVERQLPDPEAAKVEVARLKAEAAAAVPSVMVGEPGQGGAKDEGGGMKDESGAPPTEGVAA